jgi:hypothetical protein
MMMITVHPGEVAAAMLAAVDALVAVGATPHDVIHEFAVAVGQTVPSDLPPSLEPGEVVFWAPVEGTVERLQSIPSKSERRRHVRKYSEGELDEARSFYWKGPEGKLNLRAQNLALFLQVGEGVDEETWLHHFRRGDFSSWFRTAIKDDELAAEVQEMERQPSVSVQEGRALVREAVAKRYTI